MFRIVAINERNGGAEVVKDMYAGLKRSKDIPSAYTNTIPITQNNKGLPFGNPLFNLAEA